MTITLALNANSSVGTFTQDAAYPDDWRDTVRTVFAYGVWAGANANVQASADSSEGQFLPVPNASMTADGIATVSVKARQFKATVEGGDETTDITLKLL